jgi:hypothetical protein
MARGGKRPGAGRKRGSPNRLTTELKDMILQVLSSAGGVRYLKAQAKESPAAFLALVGKLLPKDVNLAGSITWEELVEASRK